MPRKKSQNNKNVKVMEFSWGATETGKSFEESVDEICNNVAEMLKRKNKSYGGSALDPIRVFSKSNVQEQIRVRIDDKLSRIKRGNNDFKEDTVLDLLGYLVLLLISKK